MASGTGLSAVSRKRVPIAMPAAPKASAATRPRPSRKPPAADDRDLHRIDHLRHQQRRRHRAGVAAALAALGDDRRRRRAAPPSARARRADGRHTEHAGRLELLDELRRSASGCSSPPSRLCADDRIDDQVGAGLLHQEVDAEGLLGELPACARSARRPRRRVITAAARNPKAPALLVPATSSGVATQPIAVWMIGIAAPEQVAESACAGQRARATPLSPSLPGCATPFGSITSRIRRSSSAVGARVLGHVVRDHELEAGALHAPRRR